MACLIDINVLLALAWPNHPHHQVATRWFDEESDSGWATCATTQLGFVRISSQPKFSAEHVDPATACALLLRWVAHPRHLYWREEGVGLTAPHFRELLPSVLTHNFVTDAFLISIATANGGKLATLDKPLTNLFPEAVHLVR